MTDTTKKEEVIDWDEEVSITKKALYDLHIQIIRFSNLVGKARSIMTNAIPTSRIKIINDMNAWLKEEAKDD